MAKIKCETVRYEVTSCATGKATTVFKRCYVRSERIGRTYRDTPLRSVLRSEQGQILEEVPGMRFRNAATGEEFEISNQVRQMRAVPVAA